MAVVNVVVREDSPAQLPLAGVTVTVVVPTLYVVSGQATTDEDGIASFTLPATSFELRFFKMGVVFKNPVLIAPVEDGLVNEFDYFGTIVSSFGVPADPRLCRCVGRFLDYANQPVRNAMVRLATSMDLKEKQPKVVDGNFIMPASMEFRTDDDGYLKVDLLRGGGYWVAFAGEDDELWNFLVPDRPTANLTDLIHPYPVSLTWQLEDGVDLTVAKNASLQVPFSVAFSDYQTRSDELQELLQFLNSDDAIIDLAYQASGSVVITGRSPGTATVTPGLKPDLFPKRVPDYSLAAPILQVTVTT
jgi:hypothetical protein